MQSIIKGGGQGASKSLPKSKKPSPKIYYGNPVFKNRMVTTPSYTPEQWKKMQEDSAAINASITKKRGGKTRKNRSRKTRKVRRRKHYSKRR
jgi:hypothetical protein